MSYSTNQYEERLAFLQSENQRLIQLNQTVQKQLQAAQKKIDWFEEQFKLTRQRRFAKQTETTRQLSLFDENSSDEVTETVKPVDDEQEEITYSRKKPKKGRRLDTTKLPRERRIYDLAEHEKICQCGCHLEKIGESISEQLDYVPAQIKVIEHIRPKYTCRACETIKSAPKPEQPLPKSMASSNLIAEVVIQKYAYHLPLYRQSKIFAQNGIDIADNTLGNWVMGGAQVLSQLGEALWEQINHVKLLQADETPIKVLRPDKKGFMWGYHSLDPDNRFVVFEFTLTRSGQHPQNRLKGFQGILQTDGYSGYNSLRMRDDVINIGCWDHARRKFVEAIKANNDNKKGIAGKLLNLINKLYKIERQCKGCATQARYEVRQQQTKPLLNDIFDTAANTSVLPKSLVGQAVNYLINNKEALIEYSNHGDTQISNCLMENLIRDYALGRKNWMFVGNEISANKAALWCNLIQTCKLNHINSKQYLVAVLNRVHALRRKEIDPKTLLPQFIDKNIINFKPP